ncbi:MAG: vitamin K epoxide reductase family protein [Patescibacteria group bacterium]
MVFSIGIQIKLALFLLGLCGFWVAQHIYKQKKANQPLVCPIGFDCNAVVHSSYSEFMHIPLEIFGMIYYALLSLFYLVFIFTPESLPNFLVSILLLGSIGAFLFSLYLIFVQIFILKKGCSLCFVSAFISIVIFILTVSNYNFSSIGETFVR